jgi:lysophospholipase L1-like esterase
VPGPDLYSWFSAHPGEFGPDGVHPSEAGTRSINRLWYEALRPLYRTSP